MPSENVVPPDIMAFLLERADVYWVLRERVRASWAMIERVLGARMIRSPTAMHTHWKLARGAVGDAARQVGEDRLRQLEEQYALAVAQIRKTPGRKPNRDIGRITVTPAMVRRRVETIGQTEPRAVAPAPDVQPTRHAADAPAEKRSYIVRPDDRPAETADDDDSGSGDLYWGDQDRIEPDKEFL